MFIGTLAALSTGPCLFILLILWDGVIELVVASAGSSHLKPSEYNANNKKSSLLYATFIFHFKFFFENHYLIFYVLLLVAE